MAFDVWSWLSTWSWIEFMNTALAAAAGSTVTLLAVRGVHRSERKERAIAAQRAAISDAFNGAAEYARDLWLHQQNLSNARIAGAGNKATNSGQFNPPEPLPTAALAAVHAARFVTFEPSFGAYLAALEAALLNAQGTWVERSERIKIVVQTSPDIEKGIYLSGHE